MLNVFIDQLILKPYLFYYVSKDGVEDIKKNGIKDDETRLLIMDT